MHNDSQSQVLFTAPYIFRVSPYNPSMAEQIRLVLTVDDAVKKLIEESAAEFCDGNVSAYVRGLVVFHQLLMKRGTGVADIPGWMLGMYPLTLIDKLTREIEEFNKTRESMKTFAEKNFYDKVRPPKPAKK